MNLTNALRELGLTNQETSLFLELCRSEGMTGYEAAKATGISRSNVYASLSSLTDKGFALVIQGEPMRYIAIPKDELLHNLRKKQENILQYIQQHLHQHPQQNEPYFTLRGKESILLKMTWMIEHAKLRLYLSASTPIITALKPELINAYRRKLKVVLLTERKDADLPVIYYNATSNDNSIKLIVDTAEILAGSPEQVLYSKNSTFVSIIRESLIYEIKLIENNIKPM